MPCYTLVSVVVKDEWAARQALKNLDIDATVQKNADGSVTVTPASAPVGFENKFKNEYGAVLATKQAKAQGYTVTRKNEGGSIKLVLRQY